MYSLSTLLKDIAITDNQTYLTEENIPGLTKYIKDCLLEYDCSEDLTGIDEVQDASIMIDSIETHTIYLSFEAHLCKAFFSNYHPATYDQPAEWDCDMEDYQEDFDIDTYITDDMMNMSIEDIIAKIFDVNSGYVYGIMKEDTSDWCEWEQGDD
jgi:hypothetical protein